MKIFEYIKKIAALAQKNSTKSYLILVDIVLIVFAIWFSNAGLLPFRNMSDFAVFVGLSLILAIYRPGWAFVLFIGSIALENINLAPKAFGLALRPYQFLGVITIIALIVQIVTKRLPFSLPKFRWYDSLPIIFALGGILSSMGAVNRGMSFKQSLVALSFVALYFLVRIYIQSFEDLKRVLPFFLSSALVVVIYGIWQNVSFLHGGNSFEVMPGRSNATFTEPDWYGIYLVFALAVLYGVIFYLKNKNRLLIVGYWLLTALILISLILTVSRSAWIGAVFVTLVFLKSTLLRKYAEFDEGVQSKWQNFLAIMKIKNWDWKEFLRMLRNIGIMIICSLVVVYILGLTRFQLGSRAVSTGGLQTITIACESGDIAVPEQIASINDLAQYSCRHINLEDIEKEKVAGNIVTEVQRPDPNINIRSEIYQKSWQQIKAYPLNGIGWGSISKILGTDERGVGLNASNIFLEVWLGAGLVGFSSFVILLGYILIASILAFISNDDKSKNGTVIVFVMLGWAAVVIPNLFNSGIFLGFVWVYIAIAISLLSKEN